MAYSQLALVGYMPLVTRIAKHLYKGEKTKPLIDLDEIISALQWMLQLSGDVSLSELDLSRGREEQDASQDAFALLNVRHEIEMHLFVADFVLTSTGKDDLEAMKYSCSKVNWQNCRLFAVESLAKELEDVARSIDHSWRSPDNLAKLSVACKNANYKSMENEALAIEDSMWVDRMWWLTEPEQVWAVIQDLKALK